ncbi:hypothetical protein [Shimia sp.]|uniref:hypothetical protein n=1 Tax=Shimia sp. TaxID=1954381 RepID=UPI0035629C90
MKYLVKTALTALALSVTAAAAAQASGLRTKTPQAAIPPEQWEFNLSFRKWPYHVECHEQNNRGSIRKQGNGGNVKYTVTGFPAADTIVCNLPNGRSFHFDMKFLFGEGNTKRRMGREYFEGEIRRFDAIYKYEKNYHGADSYNSKVVIHSVFGKEKTGMFTDEMMYAVFPERETWPKKRWK